MLNEQLQAQIEQEGSQRSEGFETKLLASVAKVEYEIGAETYAEKWQASEADKVKLNRTLKSAVDTGKKAIARAERYEKALKDIIALRRPLNDDTAVLIALQALNPKTSTDDTVNG